MYGDILQGAQIVLQFLERTKQLLGDGAFHCWGKVFEGIAQAFGADAHAMVFPGSTFRLELAAVAKQDGAAFFDDSQGYFTKGILGAGASQGLLRQLRQWLQQKGGNTPQFLVDQLHGTCLAG